MYNHGTWDGLSPPTHSEYIISAYISGVNARRIATHANPSTSAASEIASTASDILVLIDARKSYSPQVRQQKWLSLVATTASCGIMRCPQACPRSGYSQMQSRLNQLTRIDKVHAGGKVKIRHITLQGGCWELRPKRQLPIHKSSLPVIVVPMAPAPPSISLFTRGLSPHKTGTFQKFGAHESNKSNKSWSMTSVTQSQANPPAHGERYLGCQHLCGKETLNIS